jgi:hypothetical protein
MVRLGLTSRAQLAAENLFLRKQLALYQERRTRPRRADASTRVALVLLSQFLDWRALLTVVKPETLIRWHRQGWRLFWRWKSRPGRPTIPVDLQRLIVAIARANPTWGEERLANELRLKLGLTVSPRTIGRYLRQLRPPRDRRSAQRWATFVRNHAHAVLACDFFVTVTGRFQILYVFVVLEVGTRRIAHCNVTAHPTAEWTIQQFRTAITRGSASLSDPRPRCDLCARGRPCRGVDGAASPEDARANAASQCVLRAPDRDDPPGMSRLADSAHRTPPSTNPSRVGDPLQSGPSPCQLGTGNPRGISHTELAGCPGPSLPCAMPSGRNTHSQRTASRVLLGARRRVMVASILRSTRALSEKSRR